jgi:hypothetical protein
MSPHQPSWPSDCFLQPQQAHQHPTQLLYHQEGVTLLASTLFKQEYHYILKDDAMIWIHTDHNILKDDAMIWIHTDHKNLT